MHPFSVLLSYVLPHTKWFPLAVCFVVFLLHNIHRPCPGAQQGLYVSMDVSDVTWQWRGFFLSFFLQCGVWGGQPTKTNYPNVHARHKQTMLSSLFLSRNGRERGSLLFTMPIEKVLFPLGEMQSTMGKVGWLERANPSHTSHCPIISLHPNTKQTGRTQRKRENPFVPLRLWSPFPCSFASIPSMDRYWTHSNWHAL